MLEHAGRAGATRGLRRLSYWSRLPAFGVFNVGLLIRPGSRFFGDRVGSLNHAAFLEDERLMSAYRASVDGLPPRHRRSVRRLDISWRAHIVTWAGNQALRAGGDLVECGVWYGVLSKVMLEHLPIDDSGRRLYLVDAWGGAESTHPDYQEDVYDFVVERFSGHPSVVLCRGTIPAVLDRVTTDRIGFLGIDLNGSVAERAALETLYDRVVPGGVIYFDDYGYEFPELRATVDDFFRDRPERLLHFPTGQSIAVRVG